jgi:SAM-dependent methyltransferase
VELAGWLSGRPGDGSLVSRCGGPTLDVGCGPGRLTAAVASTGLAALGVDISPTAVRLTRHRGATALCRSVFEPLPAEGRWQHILLADGNIGIGGHPDRLLRRCRGLLAPTGTLLVELDPPGTRSHAATVRLRYGDRQSRPFRWAYLSADDLAGRAEAAALRVLDRWTEAGRWFAALVPH